MTIQCPTCGLKLKPKPLEGTAEGTRISVTCRCGQKLRFRMPGKPKIDPFAGFANADLWAAIAGKKKP